MRQFLDATTMLFLIGSALLADISLFAGDAWADESARPWKIGERMLPIPQGVSSELRASIQETPQPDPHNMPIPDSVEELMAIMAASDVEEAKRNLARAKELGLSVETAKLGGVSTFRLKPSVIKPQHQGRLFLYVHGGAYVVGVGAAGLLEPNLIAERIGIEVLSIDYRMPPDHPFPAAVDDVVAVYRSLIADQSPAKIILGGTSAGGGLALASILRFKELGLALPGAVYGGTAWADLTKTGDTQFSLEGIDRGLIRYEGTLETPARLYAGENDLKHPLISPVYGDFSGFPPTILVTGTRDMFLSDNARTHRKLRAAGVVADLHVFEGMSHGGYIMVRDAPESHEVYRELAAFIDQHLD